MILKALYDYYHRSGDDVAPFGLEYKEIGFIIGDMLSWLNKGKGYVRLPVMPA